MKSVAILSILLFFVELSTGTALDLNPDNCKGIASVADIWIPATKAAQTNLPQWSERDSFTGRILRVLSKEDKKEGFSAMFEFVVTEAAEYSLYAALIHQGTPYSSPVEYRINNGNWQKIIPVKGQRISWGLSNAVNWESLGVHRLTKGKHQLELRITEKAKNGNWSFMYDGIIGFNTEKKVNISDLKALNTFSPGKEFTVEFNSDVDLATGSLALLMGSSVVLERKNQFKSGKNTVSINIPDILGGNAYSLQLQSTTNTGKPFASIKLEVPGPENQYELIELENVQIAEGRYKITLGKKNNSPGKICAFLFIDEKLYCVDVLSVSAGSTELTGKFSENFQNVARGHKAEVMFIASPGKNRGTINEKYSFGGAVSGLPKPMNYGIFTDANEIRHPWYITHDWKYMFDGSEYFPVGGMWCPGTLINGTSNIKTITQNIKRDRDTISKLKNHNINDVYLNLSLTAPLWVRQYFVDMLEQEEIYYGYQLCGGGGSTIPSFFITHDVQDPEKSWSNIARGRYYDGKIEVELPKTYNVAGMLVIPEDPEQREKVHMLAFYDEDGKDLRHHIIDLETVADYKQTRKVSVSQILPIRNDSKVIVVPLLNAKMHHANFWDPRERSKISDSVSWIKDIKWGSRLRCFIDPAKNEAHMLNATENLRQYTEHINGEYVEWLKNKYKNIDALQKSWKVNVQDFATASRLIPFREQEQLFLIDPQTGILYASDLNSSLAWLDYNDMIRDSYGAYNDKLAIAIKEIVDVPVVIKSVGVVGSPTHISRTYRGFDGIGYEMYLNQGFPPAVGGGASRAQAEVSAHTMWKVGTEIGHSANVKNDGVRFFENEKSIRMMAHELALSGVRGFYFFGIDLKPAHLWENHNFNNFPQGMEWVRQIKNDYAGKNLKVSPSSFCYPGGYCFWWWTTRWKSLYGYEANSIANSFRIKGDEWASNTDILPDDFKRVVINCPYPPFSIKYGPEIERIIKEGKNVIYLGNRNDVGSIPELDKFFTNESIKFADGSVAQALKSLYGTEILAHENGKIWAIRNKNLIIVSRTPITGRKHNFKYLESRWLE